MGLKWWRIRGNLADDCTLSYFSVPVDLLEMPLLAVNIHSDATILSGLVYRDSFLDLWAVFDHWPLQAA